MSVDHHFEIDGGPEYRLAFNFSCIDSAVSNPDSFKGAFYAYNKRTGIPIFTCTVGTAEIFRLYDHLSSYSFIRNKTLPKEEKFVEIPGGSSQLIEALNSSSNEAIVSSLKHLISSRLSSSDIDTMLGRKDSLDNFHAMLSQKQKHKEKIWQEFFEKNEWIFGYGLKYRYLRILQRESIVGKSDVDGTNQVIADFLMSDSRFTKLVELKKPDTEIFKKKKNRSDSWCLSSDLTDAVSQILSQKANWEIESQRKSFTSGGKRIWEATHDVECLLIIGKLSSIDGSERDIEMKLKTLELFRRNLRNIEIVTYDELLERAAFIVSTSPA